MLSVFRLAVDSGTSTNPASPIGSAYEGNYRAMDTANIYALELCAGVRKQREPVVRWQRPLGATTMATALRSRS